MWFSSNRTRNKYASWCVLLLTILALLAIGMPLEAKKKSSKSKKPKWEKFDKRMGRQERTLMKKLIDQRQAAINLALTGDALIPDAPPVVPPVAAAAADDAVTSLTIDAYCKAYALRCQTEQKQLLDWLKTWYNSTYTPKHQTTNPDEDEDEDTLIGMSGDELVSSLLDQMIGVHSRGIAYQKQATKKKGYHPEFREFCDKANKVDAAEVSQIKKWIRLFEDDDDDEDDDD